MLIVLKSQGGGEVVMLEPVGKQVLGLLGKEADAVRGVITVEQLPAAIAALQAAIDRDKSDDAPAPATTPAEDSAEEPGVRLFQRVLPVLTLLQGAAKRGVPVTWGV